MPNYTCRQDDNSVIDEEGYRPNVGLILVNPQGKVFWGKRVHQDAWQFPQGGIQRQETPQQAAFRELREEVGLRPADVRVLGRTKEWLRYQLPPQFVRHHKEPVCIGQKQIWFLLGLVGPESHIRLDLDETPEFENYRWVDWWVPVQEVVEFKRNVYQQALTELEPYLQQFWLK